MARKPKAGRRRPGAKQPATSAPRKVRPRPDDGFRVTARLPAAKKAQIISRMKAARAYMGTNEAAAGSRFHVTSDLRATSDPFWDKLATFRQRLISGEKHPLIAWTSWLALMRAGALEAGLRPCLGEVKYIVTTPKEADKGDPIGSWGQVPSTPSTIILIDSGDDGMIQVHELADGAFGGETPSSAGLRESAIRWAESWMNARERQLSMVQKEGTDVWVSSREAVARSGLSAGALTKRAERERWERRRPGRSWYYKLSDLERAWPNKKFKPATSGK